MQARINSFQDCVGWHLSRSSRVCEPVSMDPRMMASSSSTPCESKPSTVCRDAYVSKQLMRYSRLASPSLQDRA